ncbi:exodeoxyribonuclease VII large subunit [Sedimenticola selenatireducens]|uniref:Exodeoxyribonuclease 7 large subunit n=1 Tax=Sedimenticola selenatireducens TaxID=191960 RepID=A0A2N6CRC5_9GAMM|nr:exodeoxyribonuclease VII large subunit [Sedimenticola selenatireducens]PLX59618.1 MAG: exodeoxyribonuclease VII large subunit [Sedimenticola selenatireducens]
MSSSDSEVNFQRDIYSVSRLNSEVRSVLEGSFPLLWVEGEISNLARPASGHIYFTLKDPQAQVRCAMFRMKRQLLRFQPENGLKVLIRARVGLYEGRGEFQLVAEHMEPAGEGNLQQAFDALKLKLQQEGLFDSTHKKPLPLLPKRIGIITSPSGAAVRDVLSVLQRRLPAVPVLIYPVVVQGEEAPRSILNALRLAEQRQDCDLLILTRGGGSLEDLMAFNDEAVARSIHALTIPLISAVGHEVDFTIADFVADRRAPTPSVAAELATPDKQEILDRLNSLQRRIRLGTLRHLASNRQTLQALGKRLERMHPDMRLQQRQQYLDELAMRLLRSIRSQMEQGEVRTGLLASRLNAVIPTHRINQQRELFNGLKRRLLLAVDSRLRIKRQGLGLAIGKLDTLSPLATLHRGYSITRLLPERNVLRDTSQAKTGDKLETRVSNGTVISTVETTVPL